MTDKQPDALRLADALENTATDNNQRPSNARLMQQAATELRRLHAANVYTSDLLTQALEERDRHCEWADKLADAIGEHLGIDIGEHTAGAGANNPWAVALEAIQSAPTAQRADALDAQRFCWLQEHCLAFDAVADPDNLVQVWHGTDPARCSYGKTLRAAIDAALKGTP